MFPDPHPYDELLVRLRGGTPEIWPSPGPRFASSTGETLREMIVHDLYRMLKGAEDGPELKRLFPHATDPRERLLDAVLPDDELRITPTAVLWWIHASGPWHVYTLAVLTFIQAELMAGPPVWPRPWKEPFGTLVEAAHLLDEQLRTQSPGAARSEFPGLDARQGERVLQVVRLRDNARDLVGLPALPELGYILNWTSATRHFDGHPTHVDEAAFLMESAWRRRYALDAAREQAWARPLAQRTLQPFTGDEERLIWWRAVDQHTRRWLSLVEGRLLYRDAMRSLFLTDSPTP